jgi:peroxiredoxin
VLELGQIAPDFSLADPDGKEYRLSEALAAGPVVLAFLKADCGACHLAFPYLEQLHQAYPSGEWSIWGICQHPPRAAQWFAKSTGVTFPLLIDADDLAVSYAYDPPATPTILLLDRDGKIQNLHWAMSKEDLNAVSAQLAAELAREPVVVAPPDDGKPSFRPG